MRDIVVDANAERSRGHNRRMVLGRMRKAGEIGRADIARASGRSTRAVSNTIADLRDDGLIVERGRRTVGRGLPAVQYSLNPSGGYAVGVEIRPDAIFVALLDLSGNTVSSDRRSLTKLDTASVTRTVLELRDDISRIARAPGSRHLVAGIVMTGPFGISGICGSGSEGPIWGDVSPDNLFSELLSLPVLIENDANAAAIVERISGVVQELDSYAFIYFGSGLGFGTVYNGNLVASAFGSAGEMGHIPVPANSQSVIIESVVSCLSVQRALAEVEVQISSGKQLELLFFARHPDLIVRLDAAADPMSSAIAMVENFIDPQSIIIGGAMPDCILDFIVDAAHLSDRSVANRSDRSQPRLLRGVSGGMIATLGAAALVINHALFPKVAAQL